MGHKYDAERSALKHLLEACENYENMKRRFANAPESMKDRAVMQTEALRLHVACGSWVAVKKKSAEQSVDEIFDALEQIDLARDFVNRIASGEMTKKDMIEFAQDTAVSLGIAGNFGEENSSRR
jgi:hypothetical protein